MARRGGRFGGRGDRGARGGPFRDAPQPGDWKFGTIFVIKETFGFLRPMHRPEDIYFSLRDAPRDVQLGDVVCFVEDEGTKGPCAFHMSHLPFQDQLVSATKVKAVVKADITPSKRGSAGLLTVQDESSPLNGYDVPFMTDDVSGSRRGVVVRGDLVQCDVVEIPAYGYLRAQNISLLKTARELRRDIEVRQMLDAGVPRDQGIVETIRGDFGFIRCADRKEDVYFRLEDIRRPAVRHEDGTIAQEDTHWQVTQGLEVEFFTMTEAGKDGLRNSANYINVLPPGTVQFEVEVLQKVTGVVTVLPRSGSREVPGIVTLIQTAETQAKQCPNNIELWPRVMASTLELQLGDVLGFDIIKYRPESIYFARNVTVKEFDPLLREYGTIATLKEGSFGFIKSSVREADVYFRLEDVIDIYGRPVNRDDVKENCAVSYDISFAAEERNRKKTEQPKGRATRILFCDPDLCRDSYLVRGNLRGVVTKEPQKNQPGTVKLIAQEDNRDINNGWRADENSPATEILLAPEEEFQDVNHSLLNFLQAAGRQEISLFELAPLHKKAFAILCDKYKLGYESLQTNVGVLRIWKFASDDEFTAWAATKPPILVNRKDKESDNVLFGRININEQFGPIGRLMDVTCNLCIDRRSLSRFASDITLVDASVTNGHQRHGGVVENLRNKGSVGVFGNIRDIDSQEKLLFHGSSGFQSPDAAKHVSPGTIISYSVRNRGGMRTAVDIMVEDDQTTNSEQILPGSCTAVILNSAQNSQLQLGALLLDTSLVPQLADTYAKLTPGMPISELEERLHTPVPGEPPMRFFAPALRSVLPIEEASSWQVGDIISCNVVVNWAISRLPLRVCHVERTQSGACLKVNGSISRLDLTHGIGEIEVNAQLLPNSEETKAVCGLNTVPFAFDLRELVVSQPDTNQHGAGETTARPEIGDLVECVVIPVAGLAVTVTLDKTRRKERPRFVVNEGLKNKAKLKTGVIMAKGPDATIGFVPGWRPLPDLTQVPWAHLMSHLTAPTSR